MFLALRYSIYSQAGQHVNEGEHLYTLTQKLSDEEKTAPPTPQSSCLWRLATDITNLTAFSNKRTGNSPLFSGSKGRKDDLICWKVEESQRLVARLVHAMCSGVSMHARPAY